MDTHLKFHSSNGKRLILVVEDEQINREILALILQEDYELLFAADGAEALDGIRAHFDTLSLVLLDLNLPDMNGMDILRQVKENAQLSRIPVIVLTSDRESEVESLSVGASDFIPKPYPQPKVILARIRRTIELSEGRDIIRWTERDHLTGLYNREYFYRYAEQYDMFHKDQATDAFVIDVNHFHLINERYGKSFGDRLLRQIGEKVRQIVAKSGGIVCRREADTFLVYCPHRSDYTEILDRASAGLGGEAQAHVRLRMGVYSDVDKTIDIERRFDRAQMAADTVRSSFTKAIAIYDNALHESEIFAEQLLDSFQEAIVQKQFLVYFQPKFDLRSTEPVLCSAEALVRWKHPALGMVSPGVFIPLFESNGLIRDLDAYIWREAAAHIREWKDRLGFTVPVSVNVSRVDMLDPTLLDAMDRLVAEFGLDHSEFLLEITESAYTQDADQIISTVNALRERGFKIEMDDFGSGYSSLNMISTLPIDALKLDMQFIRNAFSERKNTRMLEVVFDIAEALSVPTIAEGVETAEQLFTLKAMGCDIAQGYYFSRPLPAEEYESFLLRRRELRDAEGLPAQRAKRHSASKASHEKFTYDALHDPLTGLYNHSGFELLYRDADKAHIALLVAEVSSDTAASRAEADALMLRAANALRQNFRSVDLIFRLQQNEFAVIMTRVNSSLCSLIEEKLAAVSAQIAPASLTVGAALSERKDPRGDILQDADAALGRAKAAGKGSCVFF